MSDYYFDEYLKHLPRKSWSWVDELSFLLKFKTFRGMRVFIPDGTSFTVPHSPKERPMLMDPLSVMYFTDKGELVNPKEYQNGNR